MSTRPLEETQAFFGARAATWDARFPDDGPAYERAASELAARHGSTVSDQDLLDGRNLEPHLERHGWTLTSIDDGDDRYLAVAART
jgi:hypothetical protein